MDNEDGVEGGVVVAFGLGEVEMVELNLDRVSTNLFVLG